MAIKRRTREPMKVDRKSLAGALAHPVITKRDLKPPEIAPGVIPANASSDPEYMALDSAEAMQMYGWANSLGCQAGFPGYPYLAQLLQRSEYYEPPATIASEMTRKWVRIISTGQNTAQADKIAKLQAACELYNVRGLFRRIIDVAGQFGRSQLFIDIKGQELRADQPLIVDPKTLTKGMLKGFRVVEPFWTSPHSYNSTDPAAEDFYKPRAWYMIGRKVHSSRLLTFIPKPVPDMLKPAYNFGGLSVTQLIEPYVNQWLRTRDAVSDLIHNFSVLALKTNLDATLRAEQGEELEKRAKLFIQHRDNKGLMLLDMEHEELVMTNVPLSGLSELQAQAQEHLAGPTHIPLVKLWGITPAGLNANSDGEIRVYYDYCIAEFGAHYGPHLKTVLDILQLNEFGEVDPSISWVMEPLQEPDAVEQATIRKTDADRDVVLINGGVLDPNEPRERLRTDPNSGYNNLAPGEAPGLPELDDGGDDGEIKE